MVIKSKKIYAVFEIKADVGAKILFVIFNIHGDLLYFEIDIFWFASI
jgi:hypothetical protein